MGNIYDTIIAVQICANGNTRARYYHYRTES